MPDDQSQTIRHVATGTLPAGEIVAGKYCIQSVLGVGGMGTVYRVTNIFIDKDFALKILDRKCAPNTVLIKRFQNEAKAAFSLDHPNLVKVHDFGILDETQPYLVMDLVEGDTLADMIKQKTVLTFDEYLPILEQICAALSHAHANSVIHRDVKPANIMISRDADRAVKILDFGIAKIVNEEAGQLQELTRTGEIFGSPFYMSPEQCAGGSIDHRTDIYSLGCVTYEALTGAPPHVGVNALRTMMLHQTTDAAPLSEASLGLKFNSACEKVVMKMLAREPSARYSDAMAIIAELHPNDKNRSYLEVERVKTPKKANSYQPSILQLISLQPSILQSISLRPLQLTTLLASVMFAGAAVGYTLTRVTPDSSSGRVQVSTVQRTKTSTNEKENNFEKENKKREVHPFEKVEKIESKIVNQSGHRISVIQFPQYPIGRIYRITPLFERLSDPIILAQDTKQFPAETALRLDVARTRNSAVLQHPSVFEKIPPDLFKALGILSAAQDLRMEDADALAVKYRAFDAGSDSTVSTMNEAAQDADKFHAKLGLGSNEAPSEELLRGEEAILRSAEKWTNLKCISFYFATITDAEVSSLSRMKKLESIEIIGRKSISPKFDMMPNLKSMRVLQFMDYDPVFIWRQPRAFKNLESLSFDSELTPNTVKSILQLPSLKFLRFFHRRSIVISDYAIDSLAISNVPSLMFDESSLTPDQVKKLLANKHLKLLRVSRLLQQPMIDAGVKDSRIKYVITKFEVE